MPKPVAGHCAEDWTIFMTLAENSLQRKAVNVSRFDKIFLGIKNANDLGGIHLHSSWSMAVPEGVAGSVAPEGSRLSTYQLRCQSLICGNRCWLSAVVFN